jgi:putative endonuclease
MPYCYILFSKKLNKYYVGACTDMDRRFYEHNIGHSKFTSLGVPWELVYKEEFTLLAEAKQRESFVKKQKSRIYIQKLIDSSVR